MIAKKQNVLKAESLVPLMRTDISRVLHPILSCAKMSLNCLIHYVQRHHKHTIRVVTTTVVQLYLHLNENKWTGKIDADCTNSLWPGRLKVDCTKLDKQSALTNRQQYWSFSLYSGTQPHVSSIMTCGSPFLTWWRVSSFMLVMFSHVKDGGQLPSVSTCEVQVTWTYLQFFNVWPQQLRLQQLRIRDADSVLESAVFPPFASHLETGHLLFFSLASPLSVKSPPTAFYTVLPSAGPPSVFSHHPKYTLISHMN